MIETPKVICIGEWFVFLKKIIAYQYTGNVNTWDTVVVVLKTGNTVSGKLSIRDYTALQERFKDV